MCAYSKTNTGFIEPHYPVSLTVSCSKCLPLDSVAQHEAAVIRFLSRKFHTGYVVYRLVYILCSPTNDTPHTFSPKYRG